MRSSSARSHRRDEVDRHVQSRAPPGQRGETAHAYGHPQIQQPFCGFGLPLCKRTGWQIGKKERAPALPKLFHPHDEKATDQYLPTSGAVGPNLKLSPALKTLMFSLTSTGRVAAAPHTSTPQGPNVFCLVPKP